MQLFRYHDENVIIYNAIIDMNRKLNNLFAKFSHCVSGSLSTLFKAYCIHRQAHNIIIIIMFI